MALPGIGPQDAATRTVIVGEPFDRLNDYLLHVLPDAPVTNTWSIVVHDVSPGRATAAMDLSQSALARHCALGQITLSSPCPHRATGLIQTPPVEPDWRRRTLTNLVDPYRAQLYLVVSCPPATSTETTITPGHAADAPGAHMTQGKPLFRRRRITI